MNDTIAAIATPPGESGIGIVRISGSKALLIAERIFVCKRAGKPSGFKTFTTHYGWIKEAQGAASDNIVDEVILTVMRAPKSYTREDIVEINCHGGILPLRKTLELALDAGARLAYPGEFTQRAFLNGRIDLAQAEAVLDIIRAKTEYALQLSVGQLKGSLSKRLNQLREKLLDSLSALEASIDFPEEDLGAPDLTGISANIERMRRQLKTLIENSRQGWIMRQGLNSVICGRPNAGKSSLLNALLKCERSIVTPIAGTTRDTIEEIIDIRGIPVRIVDTAGIIEPRDLIERKALLRSRRCIRGADLILLVFDGSRGLSYEDELLIRKTKSKPVIALINKIDLKQRIKRDKVTRRFPKIIEVSAKQHKNIDLLKEAIAGFVFDGKAASSQEVLVNNLRHIQQLKKMQKPLLRARNSIQNFASIELIAESLKEAISFLDEIQGRSFSDSLLEKIFSEFCIGK